MKNTEPRPIPPSIAHGRFDKYFHACAFFRSAEEEYRVIAPFISEGTSAGEKALYIVDPDVRENFRAKLLQPGGTARADALEIVTWAETYLKGGHFDKERMLDTVASVMRTAEIAGFWRVRIVGQMGWVFQEKPGTEQLLEYEVQVNEVLSSTRNPAVCVYDVNRLSGELMMQLLRVHPMAIIGGVLYQNPFYVRAEKMLEELRMPAA